MRFAILVTCLLLVGCDSGPIGSGGLEPPTLLQPAPGADMLNAIQFEWAAPETATRYHFQMSRSATFAELEVDGLAVFGSSYVIRDLSAGEDYFWRVAAVSTAEELWSETRRVHITGLATPPDGVRPNSPLNGALQQPLDTAVFWEPTEGATSYQLQVSLESRLLLLVVDLENITETEFAIQALVRTYPYWWRVRAANPAGYGPWSSTWTFTVEG